jgi:predicted dehydrogenase
MDRFRVPPCASARDDQVIILLDVNGGRNPAIRVGLVGAGYIAKNHSLAYRAAPALYADDLPAVEQVRLADVDAEAARVRAAAWGWADATHDWRRVTRADDVDLVDIVTPNAAHRDIALDAFAHGKHVICEKPLAPSLATAREMEASAAAAGTVNQVCFYYRLWPAVAYARQLIDEGRIGSIRHFRGHMLQDYAGDRETPMSWRFRRATAGAGAVADLGSHIFDLSRYLVGPIARVSAQAETFIAERPTAGGGREPVDVDDLTAMLVRFEGGANGTIEVSWAASGHRCDLGFDVIGDSGALRFTWERANELAFYSGDDPDDRAGFRNLLLGRAHPNVEPFIFAHGQGLGYSDAYTIGVGAALKAIAAGTKATPSFSDGLRAAEAIDAALRSATEERWVDVAAGTP